jgi:hypothetical protein
MCNRWKSMTGVILSFVVVVIAGAAQAQTPRTIRYDGRLEQNGSPADGAFDLGFALFDAADAGNQLWPAGAGTFATVRVTVSNGNFVVELGGQGLEALGWPVFASPRVYVQTQVNGTTLNGRRMIGAVPFAVRADNGVPIGGLVMWWRPNAQFGIPDGFAVADGRIVNDVLSPLQGTALPNLMDRVSVGLPENRNGEVGGTWDGRTAGSGALRTNDEGWHRHIAAFFRGSRDWSDGQGRGIYSWRQGGEDPGIHRDGGGTFPLASDGGDRDVLTTDNGGHGHWVPDHAHDYNKVIPYFGLLPLIRTR